MEKTKSLNNRYTPLEAIVIYVPIVFFMFIIILPFVTLICASFSDSMTIQANGARPWVQGASLEAYKMVFMFPKDMLESYGVSILTTILGTLLNVVMCAMTGYALSRDTFRMKRWVVLYMTFTMMFGAGLVPVYILYRTILHIYDTIWVLVLGPCVMVGHVIMLRAFYTALPKELYEAATMDGANQFVMFFRIATPLIMPGIATVAFYSVLTYWNDASTAMMYADNLTPVALYLTRVTQWMEFVKTALEGGFNFEVSADDLPEHTVLYAIALATTAPMLAIFTVFQKYFVSGLTTGAVKG